jgi:hypothetical protein
MNAALFKLKPRIGQLWRIGGGHVAAFGISDALICGPRYTQPMPYRMAQLWTQKLDHGGHRDWRLPTIGELQTLHAALPGHLDFARFWSCEEIGIADVMTFDASSGFSNHWGKHFPIHAIAVRRHTL